MSASSAVDRHGDHGLPELVGGSLCLDVANSVDGRVLDVPEDRLAGYGDLVRWVARAGGLAHAEAATLLTRAEVEPAVAASELARFRSLREAVFGVFHGHATGRAVPPADLAAVRDAHTEALRHARLELDGSRFGWTWEPDLRLPRWLVARSAVELATAGPLERVKACASQEGCQYLFVDTSKNGSRRWCSMTDCGSLAKSQRLTARRRAGRTASR
ncbi:CGNR zinc finger domain-containing protein [Cellulomonas sp. NPDC055163]